jgi:hypothetical protein
VHSVFFRTVPLFKSWPRHLSPEPPENSQTEAPLELLRNRWFCSGIGQRRKTAVASDALTSGTVNFCGL